MNKILFTLIAFSIVAQAETPFTQPKSKVLNPDISANFLGLIQRSSTASTLRTDGTHDGISLQEAELQFTAAVDPYVRAAVIVATRQIDDPAEVKFGVDPEEVFLETISLPYITLKAGKFRTEMGKHNRLHTHAFPFIDAPLIYQQLTGEEGLNEMGVSAAVLLPTSWYSEVILQAITLSNDLLYNSPSSREIGGVGRFKNLFDLSDDLTMELGLSGTAGKNKFSSTSSIYAGDLTFKWRPAQGGKYNAFIWSTEYMLGNRLGLTDATTGDSIEKLGGISSWLQYQFAQRWWVQGRYDHTGFSKSSASTLNQDKISALLGFFPSEFSGVRLQYSYLTTEGKSDADHAVALQYNISIGAHPAHAY